MEVTQLAEGIILNLIFSTNPFLAIILLQAIYGLWLKL